MIPRYYMVMILICLGQASCSDSEPGQTCSMTSDTTTITGHLLVGDQEYFLVHRISGWHEKIDSFELYNAQPAFNNCSESSIPPLFGESVDNKNSNNDDQYVTHVYLDPPNKFLFEYEAGTPPKTDYYKNLSLEKRKTQ